MARLRWGDSTPSDTAAARGRLVDAAALCLDRFGLAKTTLEDVAAAAQVSRATIYRYFANRDELVLAVILRELDRSYDHSLDDFVAGAVSPEAMGDAIVAASAYLLETIRSNPKLQIFLSREGAATVAGASEAFFTAIAEQLRPYLEPAQQHGLLRADLDLAETSEWILRCILSLLTVDGPVTRDLDDERHLLATYLVPALIPGATATGRTPAKRRAARAVPAR
jgi:AcrR family transcriptional regulator